jgi:two-component system, LytTR family, sensor kinase
MKTRWTHWGAAASFWAFIALLSGLQIWWLARQPGESLQVYRAIVWQSAFYLWWIPFTAGLWRVSIRWDPLALGVRRFLTLHLAVITGVVFAHAGAVTLVATPLAPMPGLTVWDHFIVQLRGRLYSQIIIYVAVMASGYALVLYERWRDRAAAAARFETQLAEARLASLRAQLHPHFLFNSLHAIASLVRESRNEEAVTLISDMGGLLRQILETQPTFHTIAEELNLVRTYLQIQRARFGDRLQTAIEAAPGVEGARVPVLLLQPLAENALRHGLADKVEPGFVRVSVDRRADTLVIKVEDDGAGVAGGWRLEASQGTGLANLCARLRALYGDAASLSAGSGPAGGFSVTARLPYQQ